MSYCSLDIAYYCTWNGVDTMYVQTNRDDYPQRTQFFNMGWLKQDTLRYLRRATPVSDLVPDRRDGGNLLA